MEKGRNEKKEMGKEEAEKGKNKKKGSKKMTVRGVRKAK